MLAEQLEGVVCRCTLYCLLAGPAPALAAPHSPSTAAAAGHARRPSWLCPLRQQLKLVLVPQLELEALA